MLVHISGSLTRHGNAWVWGRQRYNRARMRDKVAPRLCEDVRRLAVGGEDGAKCDGEVLWARRDALGPRTGVHHRVDIAAALDALRWEVGMFRLWCPVGMFFVRVASGLGSRQCAGQRTYGEQSRSCEERGLTSR